MTTKNTSKEISKAAELRDEQLDNMSGGGMEVKSSPDSIRIPNE